jgi:hypothetical protein
MTGSINWQLVAVALTFSVNIATIAFMAGVLWNRSIALREALQELDAKVERLCVQAEQRLFQEIQRIEDRLERDRQQQERSRERIAILEGRMDFDPPGSASTKDDNRSV